jgi:hypothetical protein
LISKLICHLFSGKLSLSLSKQKDLLHFQMPVHYFSLVISIQLGAASVNLVMGEKPADVYSGIAAR